MRFPIPILIAGLASLCHSVSAQSTSRNFTSAAARPTGNSTIANTTSSLPLLTTTITSIIHAATGTPQTTDYVLTLAVNGSDLLYQNGSIVNQTALNKSVADTMLPWNETDQYLPFRVALDPAYGVLGGLLIVTGIPVAVLGGKNRWSSLAIASGYSLMLFTLVMILRFGVEPNLQPPSPNPPSTTLRGLYLLACIIISFFGAAIGIFFFNLAKYFVSAAGGFAFGWFLLATRHGGLVPSVIGRWFLLGGLTVAAFVASLPKVLEPHMILVSTAWIGATAFTLGVDCFTRGGLKEFYVYNLGFHDLFPSLNGLRYPLTQTMEIELGILAAMVIIGAAIQFRILNMLQKRLKQIQEEEEARIEAEEVSKAAERFKNVGSELGEWEDKHGTGSVGGSTKLSMLSADRTSVLLPQLDMHPGGGDKRSSSVLSLLPTVDKRASTSLSIFPPTEYRPYESLPLNSPPMSNTTPSTGRFSMAIMEELRSPEQRDLAGPTLTDPELESKMKLLDEIKKAREEVRGSLDKLRSATPTPSIGSRLESPRTITPTPTLALSGSMSRRGSSSSGHLLDHPPRPRITSQGDWNQYLSERRVLTPPIMSPAAPRSAELAPTPAQRTSQYAMISETSSQSMDRRSRTTSMLEPRVSDFGPRDQVGPGTFPSSVAMPDSRARSMMSLNDRASYHGATALGPPIIIGSAARPSAATPTQRQTPQRTMTYDELAERHRKRISQLQQPLTAKIREELDVAEAKAKWERQKRAERDEMRRRELEQDDERQKPVAERQEVLKSTDEWRWSVHTGLNSAGDAGQPRSQRKRMSSTHSFAN